MQCLPRRFIKPLKSFSSVRKPESLKRSVEDTFLQFTEIHGWWTWWREKHLCPWKKWGGADGLSDAGRDSFIVTKKKRKRNFGKVCSFCCSWKIAWYLWKCSRVHYSKETFFLNYNFKKSLPTWFWKIAVTGIRIILKQRCLFGEIMLKSFPLILFVTTTPEIRKNLLHQNCPPFAWFSGTVNSNVISCQSSIKSLTFKRTLCRFLGYLSVVTLIAWEIRSYQETLSSSCTSPRFYVSLFVANFLEACPDSYVNAHKSVFHLKGRSVAKCHQSSSKRYLTKRTWVADVLFLSIHKSF